MKVRQARGALRDYRFRLRHAVAHLQSDLLSGDLETIHATLDEIDGCSAAIRELAGHLDRINKSTLTSR